MNSILSCSWIPVRHRLAYARSTYEPCPAHHHSAHAVERVHDVRLVRAPEGAESKALDRGGAGELGHRAVRIFVASAGEPHRLHRVDLAAAEDPAGSDHADGIRAVCDVVHASATQARLLVGVVLYAGCGLFHLPQMSTAIHRLVESC